MTTNTTAQAWRNLGLYGNNYGENFKRKNSELQSYRKSSRSANYKPCKHNRRYQNFVEQG